MITIKLKVLFLVTCVLGSLWLLTSQVLGNTVLLSLFFVCFFALVCFAAYKGMVVPLFLFFLPFSTLLKFQPGTISLYTIALLVVYIIYFVSSGRKIAVNLFLLGTSLFMLTLVVKTVYGYGITNSYIMFFVSLLLIPFVTRELNKNYDFYWLTLFFVIGIVVAAITAQYLIVFPNIERFITVHDMSGILRLSGYYGDPNFYAAHITSAFSGVLILLLNNRKKSKLILLSLMAVFLIYCGFLSISKSFMLIFICLMLLWGIGLMSNKGRLSLKFMVSIVLVVGCCFLLFSTVFVDYVDTMISRFDIAGNLSDFTTGRTELWQKYFNAFEDDPLLLLFGKGFSDVFVGHRSSHNTVIQCIFQFGLIGTVLLFAWGICYFRMLFAKIRFRMNIFAQICILLVGTFGPWMGLDILFFDDFFLIPIYVCAGIYFLGQSYDDSGLLKNKPLNVR